MATPRKPLPRSAEAARLEAVALVLGLQQAARVATDAVRRNEKTEALATLADIQHDLGRAHVVLIQQGNCTFEQEES